MNLAILEPFDLDTQKYFKALCLKVEKALALHEAAGLWEKGRGGRDWSNVSRHCLFEAARAEILAEWLGLPKKIKEDLILAAALHDFNKKQEIEGFMKASQRGVSAVIAALYQMEEAKIKRLHDAGFEESVIRLTGVTGGMPEILLEIKNILEKKKLSDKEIAFIVIHYIDAYTIDCDWVESAGLGKNDLDRRVEKNKKYGELDRAIVEARVPRKVFFKNRTASEVMGFLGHEIERVLVKIIFEKIGRRIKSLELPEIIDGEIKKRIANILQ